MSIRSLVFLLLLLLLGAVLLVAGQQPSEITLNVVYRNFNPYDHENGHQDFGCCNNDGETGLVEVSLGSDGTPVYKEDNQQCGGACIKGDYTTHGSEWFYHWYHDTELNTRYNRTLTLTYLEDKDTYEFVDFEFFPLNGLANNTWPNNDEYRDERIPVIEEVLYYDYRAGDQVFLFTTQISTLFVYNPGQEFTFLGDDDVWVFIDGNLELDLGGTHQILVETIYLDDLQFDEGTIHSLDVFHAERFCCHSNFKITTSLCFDLCPGSVCRAAEIPCEERETDQCRQMFCSYGSSKRDGYDDLELEMKAMHARQIGEDCFETDKPLGFPCDLDNDDCTKDVCIQGVCHPAEYNSCLTTGDPTTGIPTTGVPTTGIPTTGIPTTGEPTTGIPTTGIPTTGIPTTGEPTTGIPTTGGSTTGLATTGTLTTGGSTTISEEETSGTTEMSSSNSEEVSSSNVDESSETMSNSESETSDESQETSTSSTTASQSQTDAETSSDSSKTSTEGETASSDSTNDPSTVSECPQSIECTGTDCHSCKAIDEACCGWCMVSETGGSCLRSDSPICDGIGGTWSDSCPSPGPSTSTTEINPTGSNTINEPEPTDDFEDKESAAVSVTILSVGVVILSLSLNLQ